MRERERRQRNGDDYLLFGALKGRRATHEQTDEEREENKKRSEEKKRRDERGGRGRRGGRRRDEGMRLGEEERTSKDKCGLCRVWVSFYFDSTAKREKKEQPEGEEQPG
ncbi:uncharacterized protein MCYG_00575 [Microsporum canis CBS 113480]|uniref:Uncharacterized protein n=1 Tax=Arthroderma otae (strain ATCC MYA-4605 / CBS 113480) TaxID=554155 RepID=C5FD03_ARTOC|nr:uncharacterized protein MCYG_00575 [Microsporum canis CBS 113480]EEQ27687.1 predicted protein [Microsporum canis CBS 113480]